MNKTALCFLLFSISFSIHAEPSNGYFHLKTDKHVIRVSEGKDELGSTGSYSVHIYDKEGVFFVTGLILPRDGSVEQVWVMDGQPVRIWIWLTAAGSGALGRIELLEFSGKRLKSVTLPEPDNDLLIGYMGHDSFEVAEGLVYRTFPVYRDGDCMAGPSGGTRCLELDMKRRKWQSSAKTTNP